MDAVNLTRRTLLTNSGTGIGMAALGSLLAPRDALAATRSSGLPELPHHQPKAKRVIYLLQNGAPSHCDLFDQKPMLTKMHGQQIPDSIAAGKRFSTMTGGQKVRPCLKEITKFDRHGDSGATVCDFLPETAKIADSLCFIKSLHTSQVNHAPACLSG